MATIMFHYGVSDANAACNPRHGAPYYLTYLIPYYHTMDKVFATSRRWDRHCAFWGMMRPAHFSTALSVACGQRACSCSWSRQTTVDYQLKLEYRVFFSMTLLVFRPCHQLVSSVYTTLPYQLPLSIPSFPDSCCAGNQGRVADSVAARN